MFGVSPQVIIKPISRLSLLVEVNYVKRSCTSCLSYQPIPFRITSAPKSQTQRKANTLAALGENRIYIQGITFLGIKVIW